MSNLFDGLYVNGAAVTPNDSADLDPFAAGLYIGIVGDVAVRMLKDSAVTTTFIAVPAGTVLPIAVTRVMATGTSATSIVALN